MRPKEKSSYAPTCCSPRATSAVELHSEPPSLSLPIFANHPIIQAMSTMNISLPDSLKDFVDEQVNERGYGTSSEYVRELIRKDQDRLKLRGLLLEGAASAPTKPVDDAYFERLRRKAKSAKPGTRR